MKYLLSKDKSKRKKFQNLETNRLSFMFFAKNKIFLSSNHSKSFFKKTFPKIGYMSRINNLCYLTGRSHSVYKEFRLSRMSLKESLNRGLFSGMRKSSW